MNSERLDAKAIFNVARKIDSREAREEYVRQVCASDSGVLDRVALLLRAYEEKESFLESPPFGGIPSHDQLITERLGDTIGPHKLLEQIGEGGFGVVFLAEQSAPVRRKVALKVIKPGMDTRDVVARFEAERQALAMMDHPNIAKVLDAGATENGRPYFVMELVQGVPITEYCDQSNLTTRERLELFVTVCQAVQHAHQKGVIHRDLKPTNVLVAMQDGKPTPKIIDFGVAKAIGEQTLTERTLTTAFAQMIGTPMYMSPEQSELSPLGVDTRSDIYSLGVMLYELLTGSTPFDQNRLHEASYDELRRIIREEEPPRPSARISTLAADLATTVAERRRTDSRRLGQAVRGELDWIVMKCLEKDRNRRYESAGGLAREVERYLHDEPVQACPPSTSYRFSKFARRNKAILAAGGAIAAALVVGLGVAAWQHFRATTESARAQAVSNLLQEMLGSADATRAKGPDYKVRELLSDFSLRLSNQFADQPAAEADIQATIARAYRSLLLPELARPHYEKAIRLRRQVDGPQDENLADLLVDYAWSLNDDTQDAEAEAQLHTALEIYNRRGVTDNRLFHALEILQHVLISAGRYDDAERVTQEALALASRSGEEFPDQANLLHRYADLRINQQRYADAEKLARRAIDMHRRLHGEHHPETAWALWMLARALQQQQKLAEAEQALRESLAIFRRCYGESSEVTGSIRDNLMSVLTARGDADAMQALASEEAAQTSRSGNPAHHLRAAELLLTDSASKDARKLEARRLIRRAMDEYGQMAVDTPQNIDRRLEVADGYFAVSGICLMDPAFAPEIDEAYRRLTNELEKLLAEFPDSARLQNDVAIKYREWGRFVQGNSHCLPQLVDTFRRASKLFEKLAHDDPKLTRIWFYLAHAYVYVGNAMWRLGKPEVAEAEWQRAIEVFDGHAAEIEDDLRVKDIQDIAANYCSVACYLLATNRAQKAADYVHRAARIGKRLSHPDALAKVLYYVAIMQARLGDKAGYRATCETLVRIPFSDLGEEGKEQSIWAPCLAPGALKDPNVPVKFATEFVRSTRLNDPYHGPYYLGAALYRAGQYDEAAKQLKESIEVFPSRPLPRRHSINYLKLILAMTKWQLGQKDVARRLLAETLPDVEKELQFAGWGRRALLELLRSEAQALIGPTEADEGVENETDPDNKSASDSLG